MRLISLLCLLAALASCTPIVYTPGSHLVPLLDAPGQVSVGGSLATESLSLQGAWSMLPYTFVHATGSWHSGRRDSLDHFWFAELGAGGYYRVNESAVATLVVSHGVGSSSDAAVEQSIIYDWPRSTERWAGGDYQRTALQIGIDLLQLEDRSSSSPRLGVGMAGRFSRVVFSDLVTRTRHTYPASDGSDSLSEWTSTVQGTAHGMFFEPVFVARLGIHGVFVDYRLGWNVDLGRADFEAVKVTMSLGLHVRVDRLAAAFH
jgi:hypothetical protein